MKIYVSTESISEFTLVIIARSSEHAKELAIAKLTEIYKVPEDYLWRLSFAELELETDKAYYFDKDIFPELNAKKKVGS